MQRCRCLTFGLIGVVRRPPDRGCGGEGMKVGKVNVDQEQDLAVRYGVMVSPPWCLPGRFKQ